MIEVAGAAEELQPIYIRPRTNSKEQGGRSQLVVNFHGNSNVASGPSSLGRTAQFKIKDDTPGSKPFLTFASRTSLIIVNHHMEFAPATNSTSFQSVTMARSLGSAGPIPYDGGAPFKNRRFCPAGCVNQSIFESSLGWWTCSCHSFSAHPQTHSAWPHGRAMPVKFCPSSWRNAFRSSWKRLSLAVSRPCTGSLSHLPG